MIEGVVDELVNSEVEKEVDWVVVAVLSDTD